MSIFTMIMRSGTKGGKAEDMSYMLIGQDYNMTKATGKEIVSAITSKKINITNMGIKNGSLVISNGASDKYLLVDEKTGQPLTKPSPVVINRAEANGKLIGYTIYNTFGVLQEINVKTALEIHAKTPFANGKIRHTTDGDIIQSIEGNYPIREIKFEEAKDKPLKLNILYLCEAIKGDKEIKYGGVMIDSSNVVQLTKLYSKVSEMNTKLLKELKELDSETKEESFKILRTKTAGFYVVLPMKAIETLISKSNKEVKFGIGKLIVSCLDYNEEGEESLFELDEDFLVLKSKRGGAVGDRKIKVFVQEIKRALEGVSIKIK